MGEQAGEEMGEEEEDAKFQALLSASERNKAPLPGPAAKLLRKMQAVLTGNLFLHHHVSPSSLYYHTSVSLLLLSTSASLLLYTQPLPTCTPS